jgi:hypothetical protein
VVRFTSRPLYSRGMSPLYPFDRRLGGPPEPVWTTWRREHSWPDRDSNSDSSVVHPVASRYTACAIPASIDSVQYVSYKPSIQFILSLFHAFLVSLHVSTLSKGLHLVVTTLVMADTVIFGSLLNFLRKLILLRIEQFRYYFLMLKNPSFFLYSRASTSVSPANLHSTNFSTITITYHLGLVQ